MYKGIFLFIIANIMGWFNMNLQFISKWWASRPLFTTIIFAFPIGLLFLFGTKYIVEGAETYWSSRLIGFSISTIIYAIFTWIILKESFLEPRTLVSLSLCGVIVSIQILWK